MLNWQKGIFTNPESLNPNAIYTAQFISDEEVEIDSVKKVRFKYRIVDANGEQHEINRSFNVKDKQLIEKWLHSHSGFDNTDPEMKETRKAKHLVEIAYFEQYPYIKNVLPLEGDVDVNA